MDELRLLPHNLEAEQSVLGSMIIDAEAVPLALEYIRRDDFHLAAHRDIFDAVYALFSESKQIDPTLILDEMKAQKTAEQSTSDYLWRLLDITPTAAHVRQYSALVRDQAQLRRLCEAADTISALAREQGTRAADALDAAEQLIYDLRAGRESSGMLKIGEISADVYQNIQELAMQGNTMPGIPSGIRDLDEAIGGLMNSNLILIASRPGMGKTSFALGIGMNAVRHSDKSVAFFSLEMGRHQLVSRLLSAETHIPGDKMLTGKFTPEEFDRIGEGVANFYPLKYYFNDNPSISVGEMKAKCRRMGEDLGLVIIDYLQLMQGSAGKRFDNRTSEVSEISRSLKIMAKELNVPVVCLSQLSRENEKRSDKRPMLSDLRDSGAIEQDADIVMFLYRDEYYNRSEEDDDIDAAGPTEAECIIAKNRHGSTKTVTLHWSGETTSFTASDAWH